MSNRVYLDNAATTQTRHEVFESMKPYFEEFYGNPSSIYESARETRKAIDDARVKVANGIGANAEEIYFTSGGTEADNWAIIGAAQAYGNKGKHIITSVIEHHAVLHTCEFLEKQGYEVTYLPVDEYGVIDIQNLENSIREDTILITIMFANNEIGTIQPIKEIGDIARKRGIVFHTDAVQVVGHIPVNVLDMNIDMLTLSGHKVYGPKGTGALYIRKGLKIRSFIHGGSHERNRRAGTENVAGIVGLGVAMDMAIAEMNGETTRITNLRNKLIDGVLTTIPHTRLNGHSQNRLPGNVNISFEFIEGESILLLLDMKGVAASSGSACTSGSLDPSHVLLAIGLPHEKAHGSLRLTLGRYNTEDDVLTVLNELVPIVEKLRAMSPLYEDFQKKA